MSTVTLPGNPDPCKITEAVSWWLTAEVREANAGRNGYLDDFSDRRLDFYRSLDDEENLDSQKTRSHHNRLVQWTNYYHDPSLVANDYYTARMLFAALMSMAGAYRTQCYLEATSAADYARRRAFVPPVGIDLATVVEQKLEEPELLSLVQSEPAKRVEAIVDRTLVVNTQNLSLRRSIYRWTAAHPLTGEAIASREDEPVSTVMTAQKLWARLLVAHIAVAASFREDSYADVPFLEPRSLTDVSEVIYPLAS